MAELPPGTERARKVVLWIAGACHVLKEQGLIAGDAFKLTPKGLAAWDQLAMDFQPTDEEIESVLPSIRIKPEELHYMKVLLAGYRDKKLTFRKGKATNE